MQETRAFHLCFPLSGCVLKEILWLSKPFIFQPSGFPISRRQVVLMFYELGSKSPNFWFSSDGALALSYSTRIPHAITFKIAIFLGVYRREITSFPPKINTVLSVLVLQPFSSSPELYFLASSVLFSSPLILLDIFPRFSMVQDLPLPTKGSGLSQIHVKNCNST